MDAPVQKWFEYLMTQRISNEGGDKQPKKNMPERFGLKTISE